jgi:hypothetical protein
MATNKSRLAKLEGAKRDVEFFELKGFSRDTYADGEKYFIGCEQVDAATYDKELAEYRPLAQARGVVVEIQIMLTMQTLAGGDGRI